MQPITRISALLALAALAQGSEAEAAIHMAQSVADTHGIDLLPLADDAGVVLPCRVEWTNEPAPYKMAWTPMSPIPLKDGSLLQVADDRSGQGVMVHRISREDYRIINRGFWSDHEITEAVFFALEAWSCEVSESWRGW